MTHFPVGLDGKRVATMAKAMLIDLGNRRLDVTLRMDSYDHRTYRQVDEQNPLWYQKFCAHYAPSQRVRMRRRKKPDTYIKRQHTLRALGEIARGKCETVYADRLLPYVEDELRHYKNNGYYIR